MCKKLILLISISLAWPGAASGCMEDGAGFDAYLSQVAFRTFGGGICVWCWSDPPGAGSGWHSRPATNVVQSQVIIRGQSPNNNCNTPPGSWPENDAGAHAIDLSGLPEATYIVKVAVQGIKLRSPHFRFTPANAQPSYALKVEDAAPMRVVYPAPHMTPDVLSMSLGWGGCVEVTVKRGRPARIISDVVISFSVPGGGSDTFVQQTVDHSTYLLGIQLKPPSLPPEIETAE